MHTAPHTKRFTRRRLLAFGLAASVLPAATIAARAAPQPLSDWPLARLLPLSRRLQNAQARMGHGRFNLASFDDVRAALRKSAGSTLTAREEAEFETLFNLDAVRIGFLGPRVVHTLSHALPLAQLRAVAGGQHLFPAAHALVGRARAAVGAALIVTSGARGVPKQMLVFIGSCLRGGVVARRVHSVAPPGYSYHAVGDIDVGDRSLGARNFELSFADSETYRRLVALPYIRLRYPQDNRFGVQFEPWHLQVAP